MTNRLTPREFVIARARLAEVINGQAGKSSYSDREAAERVLQSGFVNLDALLPKPTQGTAEAEQARLRETLKQVHDRAQKLAADEEELEADVDTMIRYGGPIGTPLDGTAGPRTRVAMHLATMPDELVIAMERALMAYKHLQATGKTKGWFRAHPGELAAYIRHALKQGEKARDADQENATFQDIASLALVGLILTSRP